LDLCGADVELTDRVNIVVGDLRLPGFGLPSEEWSVLSKDVASIYHLGATVNHVASYASLLDANVGGTLEILRLAITDRTKAVHFVSSVDVVAARVATSVTNEVLLSDEPPLDVEAYTLSKWVADQLVAQADARGIAASIYRAGYIGPHSHSGDANAAGWFELYLRTALRLGSIPVDACDFALTPVDLIVDSIVDLALRSTSRHCAFHLLHRERVLTVPMVLEVARCLGYALTILPRDEWRKCLASYCAAHPNDPAILLAPYLDAASDRRPGEVDASAPIDFMRTAAALAHVRDFEVERLLSTFFRRVISDTQTVPLGIERVCP
jgi:thioester reductase-like protein